MMHCDLRVRWKVASDLRFQAAISEPKTPSFCGISGDLAPSTRRSLAIAIVRFLCAKVIGQASAWKGPVSDRLPAAALETTLCAFRCSVGVCGDALLACDIVWYVVCSVLSVLLSRSDSVSRVGEVSEHTFRGHRFLLASYQFLRIGGGSHGGEAFGPLGTMVPQDDSSKGGAAHGPRHPSCF